MSGKNRDSTRDAMQQRVRARREQLWAGSWTRTIKVSERVEVRKSIFRSAEY